MLPLVVSIFASTLFGLTMKYSEANRYHMKTVGASNYVVAAAIYVAASIPRGLPSVSTVLVGLLGGVGIVSAFLLLIQLLRLKGISITTAVIRLSVLVPALLSVALWGERPTVIQAIGALLAVISLPLMGMDDPVDGRIRLNRRAIVLTVALLVANGGFMTSIRLFHEIGSDSENVQLFAVIFTTAALISAGAWALDRSGATGRSVLPGVFLGVWNSGSGFMLLLALRTLPGVVVFPLNSSLGLMLTVLIALWVWRERLRRTGAIGLMFSFAAAVCINLA